MNRRDLVGGSFMWVETHKFQFAELQEGEELCPTSSLGTTLEGLEGENSWDSSQVGFRLPVSDSVKDYREEQQNLEARGNGQRWLQLMP